LKVPDKDGASFRIIAGTIPVQREMELYRPFLMGTRSLSGLGSHGENHWRERRQSLCFLFLEFAQVLLDSLPVFQTDGHENGFRWPGRSHINSDAGMKFGPVKNEETKRERWNDKLNLKLNLN